MMGNPLLHTQYNLMPNGWGTRREDLGKPLSIFVRLLIGSFLHFVDESWRNGLPIETVFKKIRVVKTRALEPRKLGNGNNLRFGSQIMFGFQIQHA